VSTSLPFPLVPPYFKRVKTYVRKINILEENKLGPL